MSPELLLLTLTAASIGFFHTLLGPDHYLPFVAMAKARRWSTIKTIWLTIFCGLGHILSSVLIGLAGIALGLAVFKLEAIESFRGNLAGWLLIVFGLVYFIWGLRRAIRNKSHQHFHAHSEGVYHNHEHTHTHEHLHVHEKQNAKNITPWILFTIFVFGPCEPLIPILMYPAAKSSFGGLILVITVFGLVTIMTMLGLVLTLTWSTSFLSLKRLEKYTHSLAGLTIFLCGLAIQFLGL